MALWFSILHVYGQGAALSMERVFNWWLGLMHCTYMNSDESVALLSSLSSSFAALIFAVYTLDTAAMRY